MQEVDIVEIQDEAWKQLTDDGLLCYMDVARSYRSSNIATIVPIMAANGVKPVNMDDEEVAMIWKISKRALLDKAAKPSRGFGNSVAVKHFARTVLAGCTLGTAREDLIEASKFLIQFAIFISIEDYSEL
jgi:hypothetical protein